METNAAPDTFLGWHFLQRDGSLRYLPYVRPEVGKPLSFDGSLEIRVSGLHACERALDAVGFAPGPRVCRVKLSGGVVRGIDQACAHERTVLWMADATRVLQEFTCWCAEEAIRGEREAGREPDIRSVAAVDARRQALQLGKGDPIPPHILAYAWKAAWAGVDGSDRTVAWYATWFAAETAAESATWHAPWHAARAAAEAAANSAAYRAVENMAAHSDRSGMMWREAWHAARAAQNDELERLLAILGESVTA